MPWNGSGVFNRTDGTRTGATVWAQAKAALIKIVAVDQDTHDEDLASGLENCLCLDGQNSPSADISWNNKKITGIADSTSLTGVPSTKQVQNSSFIWGGVTGGTADKYTMTLTPTLTNYTTGQAFLCKFHLDCDPGPTINIDSLGDRNLVYALGGGSAIGASEIKANTIVMIVYDGTQFQVISKVNDKI